MRIGNVVQKNLHHFFPISLVKGAWPNNNKRKEYHRNTSHHFTAGAMRSCSSSIPPDDVSVEMAEVGKPSDVVTSSVNELDIDSLMDIV